MEESYARALGLITEAQRLVFRAQVAQVAPATETLAANSRASADSPRRSLRRTRPRSSGPAGLGRARTRRATARAA